VKNVDGSARTVVGSAAGNSVPARGCPTGEMVTASWSWLTVCQSGSSIVLEIRRRIHMYGVATRNGVASRATVGGGESHWPGATTRKSPPWRPTVRELRLVALA
jgi:hypothetical protein